MNTSTIEGMTQGQVGLACDRFSEVCRKQGQVLPKDIVQEVLKQEGDSLANEMFESLRKRVELRAKTIVRRAKVKRNLTPQEMLVATGRVQYVNERIVKTMPSGQGEAPEEVEMAFWELDRPYTSTAELERDFEAHGVVPDPYGLIQVNIDDPTFADTHPNGTQFDFDPKTGQASFAAFDRAGGGRGVRVNRSDYVWRGRWWVGGRRKKQPLDS